jgi:hypothetical protein
MRCYEVTGTFCGIASMPSGRDAGLAASRELVRQQARGFLTRIRSWPEQRRKRREQIQLERAIRKNGMAWLVDEELELSRSVHIPITQTAH